MPVVLQAKGTKYRFQIAMGGDKFTRYLTETEFGKLSDEIYPNSVAVEPFELT